MSFGFGAFPFGFFQTTFTPNHTDAPRIFILKIFLKYFLSSFFLAQPDTPEHYQNELLSRVFLGIAIAVILFIIFN